MKLGNGPKTKQWRLWDLTVIRDVETHEVTFRRRRIIETPWFALWHHTHSEADAGVLHDHPRGFLAFIYLGGYDECRSYGGKRHPMRWFNAKRATDAHYIAKFHRYPTRSLLLAGPVRRTWGYVDRQGQWTAYYNHPLGQDGRFEGVRSG